MVKPETIIAWHRKGFRLYWTWKSRHRKGRRNRMSGNTESGPSDAGEYRKKQCIHAGALLKHIKDFPGTFIHKRNCSNLDADHFGGRGNTSFSQSRYGQGGLAPAVIFMNSRRGRWSPDMDFTYFVW